MAMRRSLNRYICLIAVAFGVVTGFAIWSNSDWVEDLVYSSLFNCGLVPNHPYARLHALAWENGTLTFTCRVTWDLHWNSCFSANPTPWSLQCRYFDSADQELGQGVAWVEFESDRLWGPLVVSGESQRNVVPEGAAYVIVEAGQWASRKVRLPKKKERLSIDGQ
jgi:hypothetical protein